MEGIQTQMTLPKIHFCLCLSHHVMCGNTYANAQLGWLIKKIIFCKLSQFTKCVFNSKIYSWQKKNCFTRQVKS